ncbi:DoxX family protein [Rhodococcus jostii]|uniref:DoxX-like family protein n=1 Tax=Rhodococcus jostii TaxID=132919 RepID=A0A1H5HYQ1_RHOJO|nr:DoxX family protein [Rhodococcus jostii]SEE32940.1 DoxX-like family protein [Rhodococcus jostii]
MSATVTPVAAQSGTARKVGWVLSGLVGAFLLFDAVGKILKLGPVEDSAVELGLPAHIIVPIGIVLLICTALYLVPRTAPLGAVLLTGYLGGAVLTNWRVEKPLFSTVLFAVYVGIVVWAGLYLRDRKVRELLPLRRED